MQENVKRKLQMSQGLQATDVMVQGENPVTKQKVEALRADVEKAEGSRDAMDSLLDTVVRDALQAMGTETVGLSQTVTADQRATVGADSVRAELERVMGLTQAQEAQMHWLRAETRGLSQLEHQLLLARSAIPWLRKLPEGTTACLDCSMKSAGPSAAVCRIVLGHDDGLSDDDTILVRTLSAAFQVHAEKMLQREGAREPGAAVDEDVESLLRQGTLVARPVDAEHRIASELPWMQEARPDEGSAYVEPPSSGELPGAGLELEWVHTYGGQRGRGNVKVLHNGQILYTCGGVCVVHDAERKRQMHFVGHDDAVTCVSVHPLSAGNVAASGQLGDGAKVCIWLTHDPSKPLLTLQSVPEKETNVKPRVRMIGAAGAVRGVSFSRNGRQLAVVCDAGVSVFEVAGSAQEHPWSDARLVCVHSGDMGGVLCVEFSPYSDVLVTCGDGNVNFWQLAWGAGVGGLGSASGLAKKGGDFGCERQDEVFTSLGFLDRDTAIMGGVSGSIWIWKHARAARVVACAHEGAVLDLAVDGLMVASGGGDGMLCLWNFARDFRSAPPGSIESSELLIKQWDMAEQLLRAAATSPMSLYWLSDALVSKSRVGSIRALAWHSHRLVCGTSGGYLISVDDSVGDAEARLSGRTPTTMVISGGTKAGMDGLVGVCLHPTLPWVLTAGGTGVVLVRDYAKRRVIAARDIDLKRPLQAFAVDDSQEASKTGFKKKTWNVSVTCLDMSQDGKSVAVGQSDGGIAILELGYDESRVLRLKDKYSLQPHNTGGRPVSCIKFAPNGMWLAVGGTDGIVRIFAVVNLAMPFPRVENEANRGGVRIQMRGGITHIDWDLLGNYIRCNDTTMALQVFNTVSGAAVSGQEEQPTSPARKKTDPQTPRKGEAPDRAAEAGARAATALNTQPPEWHGTVLRDYVQRVTPTCPLTFGTMGLYTKDFCEGDVRGIARAETTRLELPHQLVACGDAFGTVGLYRYPCVGYAPKGHQYPVHGAPVTHLTFTRDGATLFTGGGEGMSLFQWRLIAKTVPIPDPKPANPAAASRSEAPPAPKIPNDPAISDILDRLSGHGAGHATKAASHVGAYAEDWLHRGLGWRETAVPPERLTGGLDVWSVGDGNEMPVDMCLEWVYGMSVARGRGLLATLATGEVLYPAGRVCVLLGGEKGEGQRHVRAHGVAISALAVHPGGNVAATGDEAGHVSVWDASVEGEVRVLARVRGEGRGGVSSLCFATCGEHLVVAQADGDIGVWEWNESLLPVVTGRVREGGLLGVCAAPNGGDAVTVGTGGVLFWGLPRPGAARHIIHGHVGKVGGVFRKWASDSGEVRGMGRAAFELGNRLLTAGALSVACVGAESFVTGMLDGRVLVWQDRVLVSAVKVHDGPVWELDCPSSRGTFRCELLIGLGAGRKEAMTIVARGARGQEAQEKLVAEAVDRWVERRCREEQAKDKMGRLTWEEAERGVRRELERGNLHAQWLAADPSGFVSAGSDGFVRMWGMEEVITVGYQAYRLTELFGLYSIAARGGHKFRPATLSLEEYLETLSHCSLCPAPNATPVAHPCATRNEAARIYQDIVTGADAPDGDESRGAQGQRDLYMEREGFEEALRRIVRLCEMRRLTDIKSFGHLDELEERLLDLQRELVELEMASLEERDEERYRDSIVDVSAEIQRAHERLALSQVSLTLETRPTERHDLPHADCVRGLVHGESGRVTLATASNAMWQIDVAKAADGMAADIWEVARGHAPAADIGLRALCVHPEASTLAATGAGDGSLVVWDLQKHREAARCQLEGGITSITWGEGGPEGAGYIAVGLTTGSVVVVDAGDPGLPALCSLEAKKRHVPTCMAFAPGARQIAVGLSSGRIRVLKVDADPREKARLHVQLEFAGHPSHVTHIDWSKDCTALRSDSEGAGEALFWRVVNLKKIPPEKAAGITWARVSCTLSWPVLGMHAFAARGEKLVNLHAFAEPGMRVMTAGLFGERNVVGTLVRMSQDGRADVLWDDGIEQGDIMPADGSGMAEQDPRVRTRDTRRIALHELRLAETHTGGTCVTAVASFAGGVGGTDPLLAGADSAGRIMLTPYPCLAEAQRMRTFEGHAGPVGGLSFTASGWGMVTVGEEDMCTLQWGRRTAGAKAEIGLLQALKMSLGDAKPDPDAVFASLFSVVRDLCDKPSAKQILVHLERILASLKRQLSGRFVSDLTPAPPAAVTQTNRSWGRGALQAATLCPVCHVDMPVTAGAQAKSGARGGARDARAVAATQKFSAISGEAAVPLTFVEPEYVGDPEKVPAMLNPKYAWFSEAVEAVDRKDEEEEKERSSRQMGLRGLWTRLQRYNKNWLLPTLPSDKLKNDDDLAVVVTNKETWAERRAKEIRMLRETKARRMFERMDLDRDGRITHSEFIRGLAANPDIANVLGLPSKIRPDDGSKDAYAIKFGEIDVDNDKQIDLREFVDYFCRTGRSHAPEAPRVRTALIRDAKRSEESRPTPHEARLLANLTVNRPASILSSSFKPRDEGAVGGGEALDVGGSAGGGGSALDTEEAEALYKTLCDGDEQGLLTHDRVAVALKAHPEVAKKLAGRRIAMEEFVFFFTGQMPKAKDQDRLQLIPFVGRSGDDERWIKPVIGAVAARELFGVLDEAKAGKLSHAQLIRALKKHPEVASKLGFPSIVRSTNGSFRIYQLIFGAIDFDDTKTLTVDAFVRFFSQAPEKDTWKDQWRLKLPSTQSDYRLTRQDALTIFHKFDVDGRGFIDRQDFLRGLRNYPSSADKLRLPSLIKQSDESARTFEMVFDHIDHRDEGEILEDDFVRYFNTPEMLRAASARARKKVKLPFLLTWDKTMVGTGEAANVKRFKETRPIGAQTDKEVKDMSRVDSDASEDDEDVGDGVRDGECWYCRRRHVRENKPGRVHGRLGSRAGGGGKKLGGQRGGGGGVEAEKRRLKKETQEKQRRDAMNEKLFHETLHKVAELSTSFIVFVKLAAGEDRLHMTHGEEMACIECFSRIAYLCLFKGRVRREHFKEVSERCLEIHASTMDAVGGQQWPGQ